MARSRVDYDATSSSGSAASSNDKCKEEGCRGKDGEASCCGGKDVPKAPKGDCREPDTQCGPKRTSATVYAGKGSVISIWKARSSAGNLSGTGAAAAALLSRDAMAIEMVAQRVANAAAAGDEPSGSRVLTTVSATAVSVFMKGSSGDHEVVRDWVSMPRATMLVSTEHRGEGEARTAQSTSEDAGEVSRTVSATDAGRHRSASFTGIEEVVDDDDSDLGIAEDLTLGGSGQVDTTTPSNPGSVVGDDEDDDRGEGAGAGSSPELGPSLLARQMSWTMAGGDAGVSPTADVEPPLIVSADATSGDTGVSPTADIEPPIVVSADATSGALDMEAAGEAPTNKLTTGESSGDDR
jgi:hypothetical protein